MINTSKNDKFSIYAEIAFSPLFIVTLNSYCPTEKIKFGTGVKYAAEISTTEISKKETSKGLSENITVARKRAAASRNARREIETETGKSAFTSKNAKDLKLIDKN